MENRISGILILEGVGSGYRPWISSFRYWKKREKEYWIILDGVWRIFSSREFSSVSVICLSEERDTAGSRGKGLSVW